MIVDLRGVTPVSQVFGYYDWINAQCVSSVLPSTFSMIPDASPNATVRDWELCVRIIVLAVFAVLAASPVLFRIWISFRKKQFWRSRTVIRRPSFVAKSFLLKRINEPRIGNAFIIFSWAAFFFLLGDVLFRMFVVTVDANAAPSDLIAIAAAASAVLFPVLLIIIQREPEVTVSGVSNPEILLHYARAVPSGLAILTFLAR